MTHEFIKSYFKLIEKESYLEDNFRIEYPKNKDLVCRFKLTNDNQDVILSISSCSLILIDSYPVPNKLYIGYDHNNSEKTCRFEEIKNNLKELDDMELLILYGKYLSDEYFKEIIKQNFSKEDPEDILNFLIEKLKEGMKK